jgi:hypothetical protein
MPAAPQQSGKSGHEAGSQSGHYGKARLLL